MATDKGGGEMGTRKFAEIRRHGRRALGVIDQNTMGANSQHYPCAVTKRAISEEIFVYDEDLSNPMKRPDTRKFAAQQENYLLEKPDPQIQNSNHIADFRITDLDQCETSTDLPVPMPLDQTGLVSSDKIQMEEVEMEDIFEELVIDIDERDATNHLAVVDYVEDLYLNYRKMEPYSCVSPNYMSEQCDINEKMRAILIDWLIEVHYKFELREETLFLTVNLIDRFLAKKSVMRKKLQMVGLIALLLACKYEEVLVPVIDDLIFISDKAYTRKELLEMETVMLSTLQFSMSLPTSYVFLTRFLKAADADKKIEMLSFFLIELSLVEYEMVKFRPSLLAAAAVYTAQCTLSGFRQWSKTCEWYSTYSEDHLMDCSRRMVGLHQTAETGKLTGVYRKYSTSKFGSTSKHEPALFLLEDAISSSTNYMT